MIREHKNVLITNRLFMCQDVKENVLADVSFCSFWVIPAMNGPGSYLVPDYIEGLVCFLQCSLVYTQYFQTKPNL